MTLTTDNDELCFVTSFGTYTLAETAKLVRLKAGFKQCGVFERTYGIEHPKWYNMERGRFKNPRLLFLMLIELGYTVTITKGE